jgi:hypothetical protein
MIQWNSRVGSGKKKLFGSKKFFVRQHVCKGKSCKDQGGPPLQRRAGVAVIPTLTQPLLHFKKFGRKKFLYTFV